MKSASLVNLLGSSPQFQLACSHIKKISRVDVTVYIEGETGTGKELAARAIHYQATRCGYCSSKARPLSLREMEPAAR